MDTHHYHHLQHMGVRELDLSACHANTFADKINHAVPGLKTSAAFFTFLRANLALSASGMSSCANTPLLEPIVAPPTYTYTTTTTTTSSSRSHSRSSSWSSVSSQASISPSLSTTSGLVPFDDIPPLSLETLDDPDDKARGLDLVADSVSQMQPRAAVAVVTHPLSLASYSLGVATAYRLGGAALACGVTVACLLAVGHFTRGYAGLADGMGRSWLRASEGGEEDIVIGARYGDGGDIVGALVLRLEPSLSPGGGKKKGRHHHQTLRGGRGIIRAWTTKLPHRGQGIGGDLLQKAVRATRERCGRDAEVGFAQQHANSTMLLPSLFNARFRRDEVRATKALDGAIAQLEASKRKR